jgi:hypothetical protein
LFQRAPSGARDFIFLIQPQSEEDFETTEVEVEDLYDKLMEMTGWKLPENENENEKTLMLV